MTITSLSKRFYQLLNQTGLMHQKEVLIISATHGRTNSSKELTVAEAEYLISYLEGHASASPRPKSDSSNQMRRKIIAIAYKLKWELPNGKVDMKAIDTWCINKGGHGKPLNDHSYEELVKLVSAINQVYKSTIKKLKL